MSRTCSVCSKEKAGFVMHNKVVCLKCDDLTFDLEIESDEEPETLTGERRNFLSTFDSRKNTGTRKDK